ncbi:MAG TPA: alpha/beta hydrolase [Egibacteraceae bacterium]|nr:alpha/beta hydrolase [Egibacteraceae bacterium]
MTILAWQQAGAPGGQAVVLVHSWARDARVDWQETGCVGALERAGLWVLAPDLPGHAESADVLIPPDAEPVSWASSALLADLDRLRVGRLSVAGFADGCMTAGSLALRAGERLSRLVLIGCDDSAGIAHAAEIAGALRDPSARLWNPDSAEVVSRARADRRHHLPTLADWAERAAWPAAARLGAVPVPVLLAVGADDPHRVRAPRLAQLFRDARLVTVPGDHRGALSAPELMSQVSGFLKQADAPSGG